MNEHNEQTSTQTSPVPSPITLEDFVEAVTRGVTRALESQDDTGGYMLRNGGGTVGGDVPTIGRPPIVINLGIWAPPPTSGQPGGIETMSAGGRQ